MNKFNLYEDGLFDDEVEQVFMVKAEYAYRVFPVRTLADMDAEEIKELERKYNAKIKGVCNATISEPKDSFCTRADRKGR